MDEDLKKWRKLRRQGFCKLVKEVENSTDSTVVKFKPGLIAKIIKGDWQDCSLLVDIDIGPVVMRAFLYIDDVEVL